MKETREMMNILHKNNKEAKRKEIVKRYKKQLRLRRGAEVLIVVMVIAIISLLCWRNLNKTNEEIKECQESGYSRSYCIAKMQ